MYSNRFLRLQIDVGGTKTSAVLVPPGKFVRRPVWSRVEPTRKGVDPLSRQIERLYDRAQAVALRLGARLAVPVAVGTPGRHMVKRGTWVITPDTARNLSRFRGEFDNVSLEAMLSERLGIRVQVRNDAVSQMAYGISSLLANPRTAWKVKGKQVGYIGPGTGLGGGFARVAPKGELVIKITTKSS